MIATELDPSMLTIGDIAWSGFAAADATDGDAKRSLHLQESRYERLAVLDGVGRLVGTVRRDELTAVWPYSNAFNQALTQRGS